MMNSKRPSDFLCEPYARVVIPADGGFHAEILEFPGCYAQGDTPEEAYANLEASAIAWIEACQDQGHEIPEPSANLGFSGRIVLRLPKSIHRLASQMAERDGVSLNQFLVSAVALRVGAVDLYTGVVEALERKAAKIHEAVAPLTVQPRAITSSVSERLGLSVGALETSQTAATN